MKVGSAGFSGMTPRLQKQVYEVLAFLPVPNKVVEVSHNQPETGWLWWKKTPPPVVEKKEFDNSGKKFELLEATVVGGKSLRVIGIYSESGTQNWVTSDPVEVEDIHPFGRVQAAALGCDVEEKMESWDWADSITGRQPKTLRPPDVWWGTKEDVEELVRDQPHL